MPPDPKPARRVVNPIAGLEKVKLQGCRLTRTRWGAWPGSPDHVDRFHLVGKDLGGDDVDENIIGLVHHLHMRWEHEPGGKAELGPRIWKALMDDEREYALRVGGPLYVERYYHVDPGA